MNDFVIGGNYQGYTFLGCAQGNITDEDTGEKRPYYQMFAATPVSSFKSEDYSAYGFKAEKLRCLNADVWKGLESGDRVKLFFDDKKRVIMAALDE